MPMFEKDYQPVDDKLNEYAEWKNDYQEANEQVDRRNRSYPRISPEQQLRDRMLQEAMQGKNPQQVKRDAEAFIKSQEGLTTSRNASFEGQELPVYDLDYIIAESLQHLYSSEDPKAEYYDWVQVQRRIEVDINTNGTTEDEVNARNNFIGFLDDRETELKLIISLYEGAERGGTGPYKEMAQDKLAFMRFKLSELRRLRDRTAQTKNKADEQERFEQKVIETGGRVLAATAAEAALEDMTLARQRYLHNAKIASELDSALEGVQAHYRPVTRTIGEVRQKQETLKANALSMRQVMEAYRLGIPKEDLEKQISQEGKRPLVRRSRSFDLRRFRELELSRSSA